MNALKHIAGAALWVFSVQAAHAQQGADQPPSPGKTKPVSVKVAPVSPKLGPAEAARRYADGVELERGGDSQGALTAYLAAAEAGHGLAQKKLGDIYGTGSPVVERDYETSLRWYERARKQGVEIPQPFTYSGARQSPQTVARAAAPAPVPGATAQSVSADTKPQPPQVIAAIPAPIPEVKPQPVKPALKPEAKSPLAPASKPEAKSQPAPASKPEAKAQSTVAPSPKPVAKPDKPAPEKPLPKKPETPPVPRPAEKIGGDRPQKPPPTKAAPVPLKLAPAEAARRYEQGVELERRGDPQGALSAYLAAGESGNGLAQKRLGDIYGSGKPFVERDYETSLHWYERARKQGVDIPKPFSYPGVRQ